MKKITSKYYSSTGVSYYYVQCREQSNLVEMEGHDLFVSGKDSIIRTTYKTVHALDYLFKNNMFDFYIRSNISTIVDIVQLKLFLNSIPDKNIYCGGHVWNLQWIEPASGKYDESLFGLKFVEGTSIILSSDIIQYMCSNKNYIDYEIVDDLSIAKFIQIYYKHITTDALVKYAAVCMRINSNNVNNAISSRIVFYRNHTSNRQDDIVTMKYITSHLQIASE